MARRRSQKGRALQVAVSQEDIAKRAYEKYVGRGCLEGFAEQDWFEAERELREETSRPIVQGFVVKDSVVKE